MKTVRAVLAAAGAMLCASSASSATHIISGGKLIGATGVIVENRAYDVTFADGSCVAIFSGCDAVDDFTFRSDDAAGAAARALLEQVLIDVPAGNFGSQPGLTYGCASFSQCIVAIPSGLGDPFGGNWNAVRGSSADGFAKTQGLFFFSVESDWGESPFVTWALFAEASVPEPATWAMMLAGFGLVGAAARRRQGQTARA